MTSRIRLLAAATLLLGLSMLSGCGSDDSPPTTPPTLELNSGDIAGGATFPHTFTTAGTYPYHCSHHSAMTGSVTVTPGTTDPLTAGVAIQNSTSSGFNPTTITVRVGGTVTWTNNNGSIIHTVTSDN